MARSYQTAAAVAELRPHTPFDVLTELREVGAFHHPWTKPARSAVLRQKLTQQRLAAISFVDRLRNCHKPGQVVAVITHGNINRLLLALMTGVPSRKMIPMTMHHTSVTLAGMLEDGRTVLHMLNCVRHLPPSMMGSSNL